MYRPVSETVKTWNSAHNWLGVGGWAHWTRKCVTAVLTHAVEHVPCWCSSFAVGCFVPLRDERGSQTPRGQVPFLEEGPRDKLSHIGIGASRFRSFLAVRLNDISPCSDLKITAASLSTGSGRNASQPQSTAKHSQHRAMHFKRVRAQRGSVQRMRSPLPRNTLYSCTARPAAHAAHARAARDRRRRACLRTRQPGVSAPAAPPCSRRGPCAASRRARARVAPPRPTPAVRGRSSGALAVARGRQLQ